MLVASSALISIFTTNVISRKTDIIVGTDSIVRARMFNPEDHWLSETISSFLDIPLQAFLPVGVSETNGRTSGFNEPMGQIFASSLIDFKTYVEIVEISFFSLLLLIFAFCVSSGTRLIPSLCITLIVSLNPYLINLLFTNSESIISMNFFLLFILQRKVRGDGTSSGGIMLILPILSCLFRYEMILIVLPYILIKKSKDDDIRSSLSEASFVLGSIVMILSSLSMFYFSDPAYFLSHLFPSLFAENGSNSNLDLGTNFNPILNIPVNVYYVILPAIGGILILLPFLYALEGHDSTSDKDWILASSALAVFTFFSLNSFYGHGHLTLSSSYGRYTVPFQILLTVIALQGLDEIHKKLDDGEWKFPFSFPPIEAQSTRTLMISVGVILFVQGSINLNLINSGPEGIDDQTLTAGFYEPIFSDFDSIDGNFVLLGSSSNFFYHNHPVISLEQIPIEDRFNDTLGILQKLDHYGYSVYTMRSSPLTEPVILDLVRAGVIEVEEAEVSPRIVKLNLMR